MQAAFLRQMKVKNLVGLNCLKISSSLFARSNFQWTIQNSRELVNYKF